MEDVLGGPSDPERFEAFLADWRSILARRVTEAVDALATIEGVRGLILAGGVGRGHPWPLSDIDLLPIYDAEQAAPARVEVERRRIAMLGPWIDEGWWTGLDVGRLAFTSGEVHRALAPGGPAPTDLLRDDRWYHSLDKGYQGRAVYDPDGLAGALARWLTDHRFNRPVVEFRLSRERHEVEDACRRLEKSQEARDLLAATTALRSAAKWLQIWLLERWGKRDASQARVGTRFECQPCSHGLSTLVESLHALCDLDDASVERRMAAAPAWVRERHDRSWRARQHVGEAVSRRQDARDVLRVRALYESRRLTTPPYPVWLSVVADPEALSTRSVLLSSLVEEVWALP
jgi:hypothetical protein